MTSLAVDGSQIVAGSVDGHARTYDLREGELRSDCFDRASVDDLSHISEPVTSVSLSQDGQTLLVSTLDSTIRLLDGADGSLLQSYTGHINTEYRIPSVFGEEDASVLTGDERGRVWEWSLDGKGESFAQPQAKSVLAVASANGQLAVATSADSILYTR